MAHMSLEQFKVISQEEWLLVLMHMPVLNVLEEEYGHVKELTERPVNSQEIQQKWQLFQRQFKDKHDSGMAFFKSKHKSAS